MKKRIKHLFSAAVSMLLAVILTVSSFAAIMLGDADGNGEITVADARQVLRFAVKLDVPSNDEIKAAADVDRNGDISVGDARTVLRAAVGLEKLPDEPAVKPVDPVDPVTPTDPTEPATCEHNFVWKQVEAVKGYDDWSDGTHIKTCTKCGVTTGVAVDCELGELIYFKDKNGNDILPTCYRSANYYQECSVCGGKKQSSFKKLPHKYNADNKELTTVIKDATCTEPGKISVKCEICKGSEKTFETRALGHEIEDKVLGEGESVKCARCGEELKPENFDYDDNEFLTYVSGCYYYKGSAKTLTGYNYANKPVYDEAEMTFAIVPGQSLYMKMPFDGSTEIGYLAYVDKDWKGKTVTKRYFETEYEGSRYYFYLDDDMINTINGDSSEPMEFPDPADKDFDTRIEGVDLRTAKQAQVVYQGNVCTRFTFEQKDGGELRVYMNGKKLLLVETRNASGVVTDATYFDFITPDIPAYMKTTKNQGKVLSGMLGLLEFANYIGILG